MQFSGQREIHRGSEADLQCGAEGARRGDRGGEAGRRLDGHASSGEQGHADGVEGGRAVGGRRRGHDQSRSERGVPAPRTGPLAGAGRARRWRLSTGHPRTLDASGREEAENRSNAARRNVPHDRTGLLLRGLRKCHQVTILVKYFNANQLILINFSICRAVTGRSAGQSRSVEISRAGAAAKVSRFRRRQN